MTSCGGTRTDTAAVATRKEDGMPSLRVRGKRPPAVLVPAFAIRARCFSRARLLCDTRLSGVRETQDTKKHGRRPVGMRPRREGQRRRSRQSQGMLVGRARAVSLCYRSKLQSILTPTPTRRKHCSRLLKRWSGCSQSQLASLTVLTCEKCVAAQRTGRGLFAC